MNKWLGAAVASAMVLSLAACAPNNDDNAMRRNMQDNNGARINRLDMNNWNGRMAGNPFTNDNVRGNRFGVHNNRRVEVSEAIARRVAAMSEVNSATVLVTDRNVYVAVDLVNGATNGGMTGTGAGMTGNGTNRTGTNVIRDNGMNGMLDRGTGTYDNGGNLSRSLKRRIAERVRTVKPDARNVYVSADPDFFDRMRGYAERLRDGRPARGFIEEFNLMVQRIFPTRDTDGFDRARYGRDDMGNAGTRNIGTDRGIFNRAR